LKQSAHTYDIKINSAPNVQNIHRFICASLFILAFAAESAHGRAGVPQGVFSITVGGKEPQEEVLANPNVDGVTLRYDWASLEPIEGVFDFSYLDTNVASVAAAGKKVLLRISTQTGKPKWVTSAVKNAGGLFFRFVSDGTNVSIPVFWDPTFLRKKTAMIAALGNHFGNNPAVAIVAASFANATSEDWNVPHTPDLVQQWLNLGYTSEKLIGAGQTILDATMMAFPNQYVTLAIGGNGSGSSSLDPTSDYVARAVVEDIRSVWPNRLITQKNDLSTFIPDYPGEDTLYSMITDFAPNVAGQMLYQCINDPTYKVNNGFPIDPALALALSIINGVAYNEKYIEIYQVDVVNSSKVIAVAHEALTAP
jgi:beta-galactosidase GanA